MSPEEIVEANPFFIRQKKKILYIKKNWKLIIHLLFSTHRFGVNNAWWSDFDSMFGKPWHTLSFSQIIQNYKAMRFRSLACHFVGLEEQYILFPKSFKKKYQINAR